MSTFPISISFSINNYKNHILLSLHLLFLRTYTENDENNIFPLYFSPFPVQILEIRKQGETRCPIFIIITANKKRILKPNKVLKFIDMCEGKMLM